MFNFAQASTYTPPVRQQSKLRFAVPFGIPVSAFQGELPDTTWMQQQSSEYACLPDPYSEAERRSYLEQQFGRPLSEAEQQDLLQREADPLDLYAKVLGYPLEGFFISWLKAATHGLRANTVVLSNQDFSKKILLPDIAVFITQGQFVLTYPPLRQTPVPRSLSGAPFDFSGIFNVLSTASFALPPPWGVATAAGLQLLELIIGSLSNMTGFAGVIQALHQVLEQEFKEHDITTYAAVLSDYMTQFQTYVNTANSLPSDGAYIEKEVLTFLRSQKTTTSGSIYDAFNQLLTKSYYLGSGPDDKLAGYATVLLIQLLTTIVINQRTIIILTAQLAGLQRGKDEDKYGDYLDLWLGEYVELRTLITGENGLLKVLGNVENNFKKHRDTFMTITFSPLPQRHGVTLDAVCHIQDGWTGYSNSTTIGVSEGRDDFRTERTAFFHSYQNQQRNEFNTWLSSHFPQEKITSQLTFAIKTWNEKIRPVKPENTIQADFNLVSDNPLWSHSEPVAYAIEFRNLLGSTVSEYRSFTSVAGKAPTLTSVPIDPLYLTRVRILHRKQQGQDKIATVFKDNTTTDYQDKG